MTVATAWATELPRLHVPEEPVERKVGWLHTVLDGRELNEVLVAEDGIVPWLW